MEKQDFTDWRRRLGLSQQAAAEALGMGRRQIQKYEAGEAEIPVVVALATDCLYLRWLAQTAKSTPPA